MARQELAGRKAVLVCFRDKDLLETDEAVRELQLLTGTLRLNLVQTLVFSLHDINPATFVGEGKVLQLRALRDKEDVFLFIFERELLPVQQRNLETRLDARVIDRTGLILQIFAEHARSSEGKIQVELAELNYLLPRLTGQGVALSRLGGGLGTRGPGEMKLEVQRRRIKERIHRLNQKIKEIEKHRDLLRQGRRKKNFRFVSLLGYTNVGKSTLLNQLSARRNLLAADQLFSTLDPATRAVYLGDGRHCLMSDTVGLLHNLPHNLIAAFKATLEEALFSDLLLCLYDASSPALERQRRTTFEVIRMLGLEAKSYIEVFNKMDLVGPEDRNILQAAYPQAVFISSRQEEGLETLRNRIGQELFEFRSADCGVRSEKNEEDRAE